jgi:hypothetical protein
VSVYLRTATAEETAKGHKNYTTFCFCRCERQPSDRIQDMFRALAERRLPSGWNRLPDWENRVTEDGHFKDCDNIHVRYMPAPFRDFFREIVGRLRSAAETAVQTLRWRYDLYGPHNPVSHVMSEWSFGGDRWYQMPVNLAYSTEGFRGFRPAADTPTVIAALTGQGEPVGHELFREAWHNRMRNSRSALVVGIAAVEVGMKEYIVDLVPDAKWLAENLPSPSVESMLRDGLPRLPSRLKINGKVLPPPKALVLDVLRKGVQMRNKVTHTAADEPDLDALEEVLCAVKDALWLLDYYRGNAWALSHMRPKVREALEQGSQ